MASNAGNISAHNRLLELLHGQGTQNGNRRCRADSGNTFNQQQENIPFRIRGKTVQHLHVLPDMQVGFQRQLSAGKGIQPVKRGQGHNHFIPHPMNIQDQPLGI